MVAKAERHGSIPAHTGKPMLGRGIPCTGTVYPRTHGEALERQSIARVRSGLSPHTRGSPGRQLRGGANDGSIPAHTGKPESSTSIAHAPRVYPRTHGEAHESPCRPLSFSGLSPHTRGSRVSRGSGNGILGSIPAHTGKPRTRSGWRWTRRVYPRTHGEAVLRGPCGRLPGGLSPHTRGSPRA